jgi:predicted ATP-binding protein involved in virulence
MMVSLQVHSISRLVLRFEELDSAFRFCGICLIDACMKRFFLAMVLMCSQCSTVYYGAMEKVGVHKRDILVTRVKSAKKDQEETKEVFASALDQFVSVTGYDGGDFEKQYRKMESAYEDAKSQAGDVRARHDDVERVSKDLFREWSKEIKQYENASFRAESQRQKTVAEQRYKSLIAQMRKAESRLDPVLRQFRDHVLFMKHNLNARAIASLEGQVTRTKIDVSRLIAEMEASMREADAFLKAVK